MNMNMNYEDELFRMVVAKTSQTRVILLRENPLTLELLDLTTATSITIAYHNFRKSRTIRPHIVTSTDPLTEIPVLSPHSNGNQKSMANFSDTTERKLQSIRVDAERHISSGRTSWNLTP